MYGIEAQSGGTGGLAAQTPYPDAYLGGAIGIMAPNRNLMGGVGYPPNAGAGDNALPYNMPLNTTVALPPKVAPVMAQAQGWRQILDWHNNPALWILILILVLYGWLHASLRVKAGRAGGGLSV